MVVCCWLIINLIKFIASSVRLPTAQKEEAAKKKFENGRNYVNA